ncbi:MAG: thymidine phosphorylase [Gammaproteobacteria bacterium]|nr:MAG: thymidine phosphorylase [Gammaproteobacteria bacterium]
MYIPQDIIRTKRDNNTMSSAQINHFVDGLVTGKFTDAQVGAMAMAIFQRGMVNEEKVAFTLAMMNSGTVLNWQDFIDGPIVDKHSTGGVGDKVSLMLAPIVAACGAFVPMISGRGLGHTGGTSDKLEAIPNFNIHPSLDHFKNTVKKIGTAIISQTDDLAPADKRLYSIRDVTSTVESIPLITASILSKKLATGLDSLVMDVKIGNGAMMTSLVDAKALARSIVDVANGASVATTALITDMNQVLGKTAGNAVEIVETVDYLTGKCREPRLHQVVMALAAQMLVSSKVAKDQQQGRDLAQIALDSGKAAEIFEQMISELGGSNNFLSTYEQELCTANVVKDICATSAGFITCVQTRDIGMSVVALGGGRLDHHQSVDHSVGFTDILPKGTQVNIGDVIAKVHAKSADDAQRAIKQYLTATEISAEIVEIEPVIYEIVD